MATILLSAVGAAAGSAVGGAALGLPSMVIGRAIGATLGRVIDQRLLGSGSNVVERGRVEQLRLPGAREGAPLPRLFGRMRIAGQVIWATRFREQVTTTGGGKGLRPAGPVTRSYSYSVSLAIGLCEGPATRVARVWADGQEIDRADLALRFYPGDEEQLPDPLIAAVEGAEAPAYRGTTYVVIEELDLSRFGNRVPAFTFEVVRAAQPPGGPTGLPALVPAVALVPGTGEYALATTPVHYPQGPGQARSANIHVPGGRTDFAVSLDDLGEELPGCGSVSLVVSWFGDDLRAGTCSLRPKVDQVEVDGAPMPWVVSGQGRAGAATVSRIDDRPAFGGTPADAAVIEAIQAIRASGREVMFYPFILMDVPLGNGLPDPWSGADDQQVFPWRGRITLDIAPGRTGSPDGTLTAEGQVAAFFGTASVGDFTPQGTSVGFAGGEWSYRRFILHYAHLCALAGGVDAFCIGSEMRSLTQIRGPMDSFPSVAALVALAADVRAILGPHTKISYAADWSEYFGYQPANGSGDVFFHLDPLWSDTNIDFIGIDNYFPLADWRDGEDHLDAAAGAIWNPAYLGANVEGGEHHDWFYADAAARDAQVRSPIIDGAHGEDWVFRPKALRGWWENFHHDRKAGIRQATPTNWAPRSKPFVFTELGCPAVDKGANQPNVFFDPKSSESALPHFSSGARDDLIQQAYLRAMIGHWSQPDNNPVSDVYEAPMIDVARTHVWAWDARPFPAFPGQLEVWSDGENYMLGHWIQGRASGVPLADVVGEILADAGVSGPELSRLFGLVRGYLIGEPATGRGMLQPLVLAHGLDVVERSGVMHVVNRSARVRATLARAQLARVRERDGMALTRASAAEEPARLRLGHIEAEGDYRARMVEASLPDAGQTAIAQSDLPLSLTDAEARAIAERWLAEVRIGRDSLRAALSPSRADLHPGDVVAFEGGLWRLDRVTEGAARVIEAVRVEAGLYDAARPATPQDVRALPPVAGPVPVAAAFLDLPLLSGEEVAHAPVIAATANPWPGAVALYEGEAPAVGLSLNLLVEAPATMGISESGLARAEPARIDRGPGFVVRLFSGALSSAGQAALRNGANRLAIGAPETDQWEVLQFAEAELLGGGLWQLSGLIRGQAGTDALMPALWPPGSTVVLLDAALRAVNLPLSLRGIARHWRYGPADRPPDDGSFTGVTRAFQGIGLRPLSPVHLRARTDGAGGLALSWIRRTRIGGDAWDGLDVPLAEESERYLLRIVTTGGVVLRSAETTTPTYIYTVAQRAEDGAGPVVIETAQLSAAFGPGPFARIETDD